MTHQNVKIYAISLRIIYVSIRETETYVISIQLVLNLFFSVPPSVTVQTACVVSGTSTVCTCNGSGDPWPSTYWTRYGDNTVLMNGGRLVVPNDAESDGSYACHLDNTVGKVSSLLALTGFGKIFIRQIIKTRLFCEYKCYIILEKLKKSKY